MIPSDRFTLTDDGHAWWLPKPVHRMGVTNTVGDDYYDISWFAQFDRPCCACDGNGCYDVTDYDDLGGEFEAESEECEDCGGTGRHTFSLPVASERCLGVENGQDCGGVVCRWNHEPSCVAYRVSVVPGMVLPILTFEESRFSNIDHVAAVIDSQWPWYYPAGWQDTGTGHHPVSLPPAAAPGMWAVKLRVAP